MCPHGEAARGGGGGCWDPHLPISHPWGSPFWSWLGRLDWKWGVPCLWVNEGV